MFFNLEKAMDQTSQKAASTGIRILSVTGFFFSALSLGGLGMALFRNAPEAPFYMWTSISAILILILSWLADALPELSLAKRLNINVDGLFTGLLFLTGFFFSISTPGESSAWTFSIILAALAACIISSRIRKFQRSVKMPWIAALFLLSLFNFSTLFLWVFDLVPGQWAGWIVSSGLLVTIAWITVYGENKGLPKNAKWPAATMTVVIAAMTLSAVYYSNQRDFKPIITKNESGIRLNTDNLLIKKLHTWNMFHYILATKYIDEVGYFDLYYAALLADLEGRGYFRSAPRVRDQHTYEHILMPVALERAEKSGVRNRFTDDRWEDFKLDLQRLQIESPKRRWGGPIADRGFNASPAWLAFHYPLLNAINLRDKNMFNILASVQIPLYAFAFVIALWTFGLRTTLLATLWFSLYFGNHPRILGGYFPYDWFVLTVAAVALYSKGRRVASTPFLAYSAMMRGFPGLLALHPAVCWVKSLFSIKSKQGALPKIKLQKPDMKHTKYLVALVIMCLVFVALGGTNKRGPGIWLEWKEKVSLHSDNHAVSYNRIGLQYLFAKDYATDRWNLHLEHKERIIKKQMPYYRIAQVLMMTLIGLAMLRRNPHDGMLLGFAAVFCLMLLSRYYFALGVLFFTWTPFDKLKLKNLLSSIWLFALIAYFYHDPSQTTRIPYKTWYFCNLAITLYIIAVCVNFLAGDLKHLKAKSAV